MCVCAPRPHPQPLSKRRGEHLLVNGMHRKNRTLQTFAFETRNIRAKGIPLSFGEGLGVWLVSQKQPTSLGTHAASAKPRRNRPSYFVLLTFLSPQASPPAPLHRRGESGLCGLLRHSCLYRKAAPRPYFVLRNLSFPAHRSLAPIRHLSSVI